MADLELDHTDDQVGLRREDGQLPLGHEVGVDGGAGVGGGGGGREAW